MLPELACIVSPSHTTLYHLAGPVSAFIVPVLFNLFLIAALLDVCLSFPGSSTRAEAILWSILIGLTPCIVMRDIASLYQHQLPHFLRFAVFIALLLLALVSCCLWTPSRCPLYGKVYKTASTSLGFVAILGCILMIQSIWIGWKTRHLNDVSSIAPPAALSSQPHHPRILWIVFDELSYDQVYASRYPGLQLPTLDRFAQESTVFTHVVPAGTMTDAVLPSLISGVPDDKFRASTDGQHIDLHVPATPSGPDHWHTFNQAQTVFADAKSLGYHAAIVGWYNPYCRLLANELSSCLWSNNTNLTVLFPAQTIRGNLFSEILFTLHEIPGFLFAHRLRPYGDIVDAQQHIKDYTQLYRAADSTLANPSLDFVLLHLPIPHPFGIYDRTHAVLTTGPSTYIDNLALVDRYLDHLRQTLLQQHTWDDTTILIMGDHSWRTKLIWESNALWSPEEQRASHGGQFDDRPFFALKLPSQQSGVQLHGSFHASNTRLLLDALLHRQIQTPQQLALWVQQHP